ncbi:D-ribose pyranase [Rhodospirillum rubrum]|uniref:D-ribose pyranase n=1 Tax=Rhodospirillum rubrum TaxID=1085 RepID=UPI001908752B|nr:D-ribose pyranase [Rhodospirillum rubrum]MBK1664308.1 D-ribose pyranase [Rhodospirillum rubrum]MBK1677384.1 D-ribose pyranase [Rhodospirillum rubrum]
MKPNRILHPEMARAFATLGHGDIVMVTDAGFPIPAGAVRIDLGFYQGLPDVLDILRVVRQELFVEDIHFATEVRERNPDLYGALQTIFTGSGASFRGTTHETLCGDFATRAKVIVRSGSFNPWANFALSASTDPFAWFTADSKVAPLPAYEDRRRRIEANEVPRLDA